jgi:transcriptional regulator with XRE-family HTH domain
MEIAERVGVAQPLISRWFSGSCMPRPSTIKRLATALEVSEKELLVYLYEKHQNLARL